MNCGGAAPAGRGAEVLALLFLLGVGVVLPAEGQKDGEERVIKVLNRSTLSILRVNGSDGG